jgi:hypothetical protein
MDKTFFEKGETIEEFLSSLTNAKEKFTQLMDNCQLTQTQLDQAAALPSGTKGIVIAEEWSGDVLYYLPVFFKVAQAAGWDVRVFRRDTYPDLILPYRKDGLYHSIPVFVFYDQDFNEIANWIERPAEATRVIDEESLNLRRRLREENKGGWRQETINELLTLL